MYSIQYFYITNMCYMHSTQIWFELILLKGSKKNSRDQGILTQTRHNLGIRSIRDQNSYVQNKGSENENDN